VPLDPVLQQMLEHLPVLEEGPVDYPAVRQQAEAFVPMIVGPGGVAEVAEMEERELTTDAGGVPVRIYRPTGKPTGTLHYIHGGGWSVGNLTIVDHTARRICRDLSMVVVTSTYRLAPEHPFPAAFDDSLAAARWVLEHRDELGGSTLPVLIGGDSAGGNLAAAVCIAIRDAASAAEQFDLQLLLYPAVDLRENAGDYPSRLRDADPTLRSANLPVLIRDYAGGADLSDPRISPMAAKNLGDLPPALVVVLSVDPLRDEAVEYAEKLLGAGTSVELMEFDNLTHGFVHFAGIIPAAAKATDEVVERVKTMLEQRSVG